MALLLAGAAGATEVWKWRDAQGVTHYGAAPPDDARTKAERVDLPDTRVSEADRRAAEKRLADEQAGIRAASDAAPPRGQRFPGLTLPAAAASAVPSCEEAWRRYNESYACFDPYRYGAGKVRPEAWQHCKELPQPPALCR